MFVREPDCEYFEGIGTISKEKSLYISISCLVEVVFYHGDLAHCLGRVQRVVTWFLHLHGDEIGAIEG